jgi:hypothetical protein
MGIEGVSDKFNKRLAEMGKEYLYTYDNASIMDSYIIPEGWRLVHKQQEIFWTTPSTRNEVCSTAYKYKAFEE